MGSLPTDLPRAPIAADGTPAAITGAADLADASVCALTELVVAGDRLAYERLFRLRCDFVDREAGRRLSRRRDLAQDASQETWLRVARAPRRCESWSKLDAWLQRIVSSVAIDLLRSELARRAREDHIAESRREAQLFVADVELLEGLRAELNQVSRIPFEERAMLELKVRSGGTLAQLGAILGIGRAAVDSRLRRAAATARAALCAGRVEVGDE
jgi:RNA polymerase sigma factor (sigma-70 family)